MVKVEFLGPIGKSSLEVEATSLRELKEILKREAGLESWLSECAVAVNDTLVSSLEVELKSGDRVSLLPPVCGG